MQQQASSTDSERDSLRALIDQKTKEWEAQNGKIETLDIVKKDPAVPDYYRKSTDVAPAAEDIKAISQSIAERHPVAECLPTPAAELGAPTVTALHSRASRLKVKRPIINHPNALLANDRAQKVAEKLGVPERSVRYYRKRLAEINQEADAIEAKINAIASIGKRSHEAAG